MSRAFTQVLRINFQFSILNFQFLFHECPSNLPFILIILDRLPLVILMLTPGKSNNQLSQPLIANKKPCRDNSESGILAV